MAVKIGSVSAAAQAKRHYTAPTLVKREMLTTITAAKAVSATVPK